MTHAYPETEMTGGESDAGALKGEQGGAAAAKPTGARAARARRIAKPKPGKAGREQTKAPSDQPKSESVEGSTDPDRGAQPKVSKLDRLVALLRAPEGATLPELASATGWQVHSVRGAMAGALRKKGHCVISEKAAGGLRRYRIEASS
jgi:hypothetical protein